MRFIDIWRLVYNCSHCGAKLEIAEQDLLCYYNDRTNESEPCFTYYVECEMCKTQKNINRDALPNLIRKRIEYAYNKKEI